jgi:hypothetical protein
MSSTFGDDPAVRDAIIRAVNQATKDWVRHVLGECDPDVCTGTHDSDWWARSWKGGPRP